MRLVVVGGPETGRVIRLGDENEISIGRGQASQIRLNDPRVSRVHCKFYVGPTGVVIEDAGSTGGTFVGRQRVERHELSSGDEIQIGESRLRFESAPQTAAESGTRAARANPTKALGELVGQTLGHFKLEKINHVGSSSVLFRGEDQKHGRPALIKVMLPSVMSDEEQRARFVRAVHTMISVRHPNLVEVYGAGKQGPFCWCAMEFIDGINVSEIVELVGTEGRLDWREVYRIAVHVGRALECAYANKIVHRNVTPDNLIQRKNDKAIKLCDLMLAKALEGTQARQVTAPGQLVGNVAYMSPERVVDSAGLDWRSDQYGLGATVFALLTGQPPFQSPSLPELVRAIRDQTPTIPKEVADEIAPSFQEAVLKMLSKSPEDRFNYPSSMLRRLNEIGEEHHVDADVLFNS